MTRPGGLGDRQRELRDMLGRLQRGMRELGMNAPGQLDGAGEAMERAERALREGDLDGATQEETRALEQLRQGARDMAQQMLRQMPSRYGLNDSAGELDPMGRPPQRTDGPDPGVGVKVPDQIDAQRAREILEELRRRLGEQIARHRARLPRAPPQALLNSADLADSVGEREDADHSLVQYGFAYCALSRGRILLPPLRTECAHSMQGRRRGKPRRFHLTRKDPRTRPDLFQAAFRNVPQAATVPYASETMAKKRMVLEIGMGTDIRGSDPTKAPAGRCATRCGTIRCPSLRRSASRAMP